MIDNYNYNDTILFAVHIRAEVFYTNVVKLLFIVLYTICGLLKKVGSVGSKNIGEPLLLLLLLLLLCASSGLKKCTKIHSLVCRCHVRPQAECLLVRDCKWTPVAGNRPTNGPGVVHRQGVVHGRFCEKTTIELLIFFYDFERKPPIERSMF